MFVETLAVSAAVVAIGEIGDKTQLLALMLATRYRRPGPIVAGILVATLANHAIAGVLGSWVQSAVPAEVLRWLLGLSFLAVALWALVPDTLDADPPQPTHAGVFAITTVAFFLAEMGDKTQVATVMLAARFDSLAGVIIGTTLGMLAANVPMVFAGRIAAERLPLRTIRILAAVLFAAMGAWVLVRGVPAG